MENWVQFDGTVRRHARALTLTLMRVTLGVIMATHGFMKLTDLAGTQVQLANLGVPMPELAAYLAIAGELLGGLGLIVGLLTPIAALGPVCTMIVAIVFVHLENGLLAREGGFEYPLTMLVSTLYIAVRGGGPYSLDAWLARRKGEPVHPKVPGQHPAQTAA